MKANAAAILLSACLALILGLAGCGAVTSSLRTGVNTAAAGQPVSLNERLIDERVFPKDKVVNVEIVIDPDEFQSMLDNAANEEYKTATVNYNGQVVENVGIRTKGNLSLRSVVNSDSDRFSFKLAFEEYLSSQSLLGLTKINLNNNYSDATYMREYLTYELAASMGLPTPKYSFVNVYVNGIHQGFYLAVEQIGDEYLQRNFGNSNGALYKANGGAGSELNWLGKMESYTGLDLKSKPNDGSDLLAMLNELNNGNAYESCLDVDAVLKYIALNTLTANMDSYMGQNKHNYYLYENKGKFLILPWDYNMAFGGLGSANMMIDEPTQGAVADRPLVAKLLQVPEYKEKYHHYIADALKGFMSESAFGVQVEQLADLISNHVEKDSSAFYTYDQYKQGLAGLKTFVAAQVTSFTKQLDGTSPISGTGAGSGGGMRGGAGGAMPAMGANGQGGQRIRAGGNGQAGAAGQGGEQAGLGGLVGQGGQVGLGGQAGQRGQAGQGGQPGRMDPGMAAANPADPANGQAIPGVPNGQAVPGAVNGQPVAPGEAPADGQLMPDGIMPPVQDGNMLPGQMGQRPEGFQGGPGGGRPGGPGGMGGSGQGPLGTASGTQAVATKADVTKHAAATAVSVGVLLLSSLVVGFYKRKVW
jgi:spore coat protein H